MTEYHEGVPVLPPDKASAAADKLRIQIIGVRTGWAAWAAREAATAEDRGEAAADERWRELLVVGTALRTAEAQLEAAIEIMEKERHD